MNEILNRIHLTCLVELKLAVNSTQEILVDAILPKMDKLTLSLATCLVMLCPMTPVGTTILGSTSASRVSSGERH